MTEAFRVQYSRHVLSRNVEAELDAFLRTRGATVALRTPGNAVRTMVAFYRETHAEDCAHEDGDMLLFQWGTYDWHDGHGPHFELDITRQFIQSEEVEDEDIWQLHLTFCFPPTDDLRAVGKGDRWCRGVHELTEFETFVLGSQALAVVADRLDGRFAREYECAG
jgi:hypothetical protein